MNETEGLRSETQSRTIYERGWKVPRVPRSPWWAGPGAILAVAVILGSAGVALLRPSGVEQEWSAISLSFGSDPISQNLVVQFSRVSFIDQPAEFNTSGFGPAQLLKNGSWTSNSSGYAIVQFNDTSSKTAILNYNVTGFLGANVSYAFVDQRVALNGTTGSWNLELSEANVTTSVPASGNVTNANAGVAQNALWVTATASASHTFTFAVGDFEEKAGGYQTYTSTAFPSQVNESALRFFEVYVYAQPTSTVVSVVNTTDAAVLGSETVHPVLDHNLTKLGHVADLVTAGSGTYAAMIVDEMYLVDHNAFQNVPTVTASFRPMLVGDQGAGLSVAPFDPTAAKGNLTSGPQSSGSWSSVSTSLGAFSSVLNSSTPAAMSSSQVPSSLVINRTFNRNMSTAPANYSLATLRAAPEDTQATTTASLYLATWTPSTIASDIHAFLTNYISGQTGIPAADVEIQGYLISSISVDTVFSSAAASTIHDYLASAIPAYLSAANLSLVNTTTGAIAAGADIGEFMDLATGAVLSAGTRDLAQVFDPVDGRWYASPEAAGFPSGSTVDTAGSVYVPQATLLGWTASGQPEFEYPGCFIICTSSLSGAAAAVSSFAESAAKTVTNAVGTVTSTVSDDVIEPVTGTLSNDLSTLSTDVSQATANVLPVLGATTAAVGSAISSTLGSSTLGSVSSALGSAVSGAAGALLAGVDTVSNSVYNLGASAVSAASKAGSSVVNTLGTAVNSAAAVVSPFFASVANIPADVAGTLGKAGESLASLGASVANAGMNALDTVGHAIETVGGSIYGALSGAWKTVSNAFGSIGTAVLGALGLNGDSAGGSAISWLTGLGGSGGWVEIVVIVVIVALVGLVLFAVFWLMPHRKHKSGAREHHERGRRSSPA